MRAMSRSLHLGKSTMDNGWGMFVNMLQRKVKKVIKVDKWFPSSKLCPKCGTINTKLTLKDRIWICECGNIIDRDYNAANNILIEGLSQL
jgi:putative transposase